MAFGLTTVPSLGVPMRLVQVCENPGKRFPPKNKKGNGEIGLGGPRWAACIKTKTNGQEPCRK